MYDQLEIHITKSSTTGNNCGQKYQALQDFFSFISFFFILEGGGKVEGSRREEDFGRDCLEIFKSSLCMCNFFKLGGTGLQHYL